MLQRLVFPLWAGTESRIHLKEKREGDRKGAKSVWHITSKQPRACLKHVNMPNRRVFCPLDGAIFPCNPPGFLRKNCLPAAQNSSLLDTSPIFKQALEKATQESILKQLADAKLRRDYADAVAVLDRIPKEVLAEYMHKPDRRRMNAYDR